MVSGEPADFANVTPEATIIALASLLAPESMWRCGRHQSSFGWTVLDPFHPKLYAFLLIMPAMGKAVNLEMATIVLVMDLQLQGAQWPVGKIINLHASSDSCLQSSNILGLLEHLSSLQQLSSCVGSSSKDHGDQHWQYYYFSDTKIINNTFKSFCFLWRGDA